MPQQLGARAQLVHAAIQVGIAGGALRDARRIRPDPGPAVLRGDPGRLGGYRGADPHTIHRFGGSPPGCARPRPCSPPPRPRWTRWTPAARRRGAARGSIAVAQAKAFASEVAVAVASDLFALTGASAADERHDLSRHWRNARTHASHDPVDWKYHHVGNFLLNDVLPPNHGQSADSTRHGPGHRRRAPARHGSLRHRGHG